jgi:hypothetical protein
VTKPAPRHRPRRASALSALALVLLLAGAACGDDDDSAPSAPTDTSGGPQVGDHVHAAYGIFICDHFEDPLFDAGGDPLGIHTHGDGLIHIHPFSEEAAGDRATLKLFLDDVGVEVTPDGITRPPGVEVRDGDDCNGKPSAVQIAVWDGPDDPTPTLYDGEPTKVPLKADELITIAFAPAGTDIPKPPSASIVGNPGDI